MSGERREATLSAYVTPIHRQCILLMDGNAILAYLSTGKRLRSGLYTSPSDVLRLLLLSLPWVNEEDVDKSITSLNPVTELQVVKVMAAADLPLLEKENTIKVYLRERVREVRK